MIDCLNINISRLGWKQPRPKITKFLRSRIRYGSTGAYENYWRFIWRRLDFTVEWHNRDYPRP